jgi:hypothetical protein
MSESSNRVQRLEAEADRVLAKQNTVFRQAEVLRVICSNILHLPRLMMGYRITQCIYNKLLDLVRAASHQQPRTCRQSVQHCQIKKSAQSAIVIERN